MGNSSELSSYVRWRNGGLKGQHVRGVEWLGSVAPAALLAYVNSGHFYSPLLAWANVSWFGWGLYNLGWPGSCYIDQAGLNLGDLPVSAFEFCGQRFAPPCLTRRSVFLTLMYCSDSVVLGREATLPF